LGTVEKRDGAASAELAQGADWYAPAQRDWFILRELVGKDFKLKYRRSFLGVAWSVLNPLLMMFVMTMVFSFFLRYSNIEHYSLYLIIGNITWAVFSDSTNNGIWAIINASSLLKKVKVNKLVFPAQKVLFSLVNFGFSLIAVVIVMLFEGVMPSVHLLWLPLILLLLLAFCMGMALLLSALAVFFRDVIHLWGVALMAWMYATPIFWPQEMIADVPYAAVRVIMQLNPMYNFINAMRCVFIWDMAPTLRTWLLCGGASIVALVLGYLVFRRSERKFILYI
jgi:ABC-2 type transport system permease protein